MSDPDIESRREAYEEGYVDGYKEGHHDAKAELEDPIQTVAAHLASFAKGKDFVRKELGWQPISSAPNDGTVVFLYDPDGAGLTPSYYFAQDNYWVSCKEPTHWMPIPEPPKATREADLHSTGEK